jgi:hypothetical protein
VSKKRKEKVIHVTRPENAKSGDKRFSQPVYPTWDSSSSEYEIIEGWWREFHEKVNYPLYGTILADKSDIEVAKFAQNYLTELDTISGKDCCFIYFRDLSRAKDLLPFDFSEHAQRVYPLAKLIGVDFKKFPCFLFFEVIDSGQYVYISLAGRSQQEIIALARQIFDHIGCRENSEPLTQLRTFKYSQALKVAERVLLQNAVEIGKETLVESLKSLVVMR